ncbi:PAS domain-containing sensor histidine kinase [Vibrio sp. PP-XX7]
MTTAGDVVPVSVNITPIIQDDDQYIGIACMVRDISDYKNYQQELLKMAQGLEEQVIERTKELLTAHKTASDINQLKSIFISNLSHEIRTQLNNITGMLGLIQKESLTTSQRRFFRIIDNSTYTLLYLATEALELSNPEGGELALRPENFNLIALVEILISTVTFQAQRKHLELILDVSDVTWVTMRGDVNRFKHIIMNLVGNAIQYTDNGSVLVTIASQRQEDGRIRVDGQVIDSGCGMTKEKQAALFQETRHSNRSKISSLSLCKQICELMSGDLEVQSEEYKGSTFHFHIYLQPLENTQTPTIVKSLSALTFEIYSPDLQVTTSLEKMLAYFGGRVLHMNDLLSPMSPAADVIFLDPSS